MCVVLDFQLCRASFLQTVLFFFYYYYYFTLATRNDTLWFVHIYWIENRGRPSAKYSARVFNTKIDSISMYRDCRTFCTVLKQSHSVFFDENQYFTRILAISKPGRGNFTVVLAFKCFHAQKNPSVPITISGGKFGYKRVSPLEYFIVATLVCYLLFW